jgi:hypothetical protein
MQMTSKPKTVKKEIKKVTKEVTPLKINADVTVFVRTTKNGRLQFRAQIYESKWVQLMVKDKKSMKLNNEAIKFQLSLDESGKVVSAHPRVTISYAPYVEPDISLAYYARTKFNEPKL